ncbi:phosphoribosyltransferase family protein [Paenibacillus sp. MBLB4367]|uniref:phosphoribosyltransferase family protein n=1 Tax=Paenibacillus sp. MBLB4367 TaxID=3384767 RepID=UPI003907FC02
MDVNGIMNWFFGIVGVVGAVASYNSEHKRKKEEKMRKTLTWAELQAGTNDICKELRRKQFEFDVILTPNLRGGIISELIKDHFDRHIPVFVGQIFWREMDGDIPVIPEHFPIETGKWMLYLPDAVANFKDSRLLIVDDFAMSGDTVFNIKKELVARGFQPKNIGTFSLITTPIAKANNKAPDFHWRTSEDNSFYFPWGKAK